MVYLRNAWYNAAWDHEIVEGEILSRRYLDEPVILFRDLSGSVKALGGMCPHRMAPLARGRVVGDAIQCGYHGLVFDKEGLCTKNPFGATPKNVRIRSYPIVERHRCVWIWMGDEDKADDSLIPDFSFLDGDTHFSGRDYLHVNTSYLLEIDNLLDGSHIEFLHPTTLGSGQVSSGEYVAKQDGDTVWSNRYIENEMMTEGMSYMLGTPFGEPADRWINIRWDAPANVVIFPGAVPTGRPHSEGYEMPGTHLFTPETARTTHYWYAYSFPKSVPNAEAKAEETIKYMRYPFEHEDKPMLEDQQLNIGDRDLLEMKLFWLPGDAAGGRARKILRDKIAAEQDAKALSAVAAE